MEKQSEQKNINVVVFDSGIGGLNLLHECAVRVPQAHYYFISDNDNVPYGNKSEDEILSLTLNALNGIETLSPAALIVACNTVTAHCIGKLRSIFDFPVVGIQPAVKQAAKVGGKCLVLATEATVKSQSFLALVSAYSQPETEVTGCAHLAEYIEKNILNLPGQLPDGLLPDKKADSVVLGCTHYAFVKEQIKRKYGGEVFDGMAGTAAHFAEIVGMGNHFLGFSGIADHHNEEKLNITFLKGDCVNTALIYENMFGI